MSTRLIRVLLAVSLGVSTLVLPRSVAADAVPHASSSLAQAAAFVVTNTADSGPGSLREAIASANTAPGLDTVEFAIDAGHQVIRPLTELPEVTDPVVIDGWSQPGFVGVPLIELDGSLTCVACEDSGLSITAGGSTVRGLVVADFAGAGLKLLHGGGNVVVGNYVGTDVSGTVPRGNGHGVLLAFSSGNTIGGASTELRNVVSGNLLNGVVADLNSNGNVILGNYIGTDVTGTIAVPNARAGVQVTGSFDNIIGGDPDGAGNLISGNTKYGIIISHQSERNVVSGNHIGTDVTGSTALPNHRTGVLVWQSDSNLIGGAVPGAGNVISGNLRHGLNIDGSDGPFTDVPTGFGRDNRVEGNLFGTDASGTYAVPNGLEGVLVFRAPSNVIGGEAAEQRNVISGNDTYGVHISGPGAERNVVSGNYIGTDVSGSSAVGNGKSGVFLNRAGSSVIGGDTAGSGNVISGNLQHGVWLSGAAATGNRVEGNLIGVGADGVSPLGNATHGVRVAAGASNNQIGAATSGGGNTIAHNGRDGVSVTSDIVGTAVAGNSMAGNFQLGIDLGEDGATANDAGDVDEGANDLQNHPVLGSALLQPDGDLEVRYLVDSAVGSSTYPLRVEFFLADTSGAEGAVYVGADVYEAADAGSEVTVTFTPAVLLAGASLVVATATDADGDTSEFSGAVPVGGSVLTVTTTADSGPGSLREAITLANAMTASQRIEFSIGTGHQVIRPLTVLPLVTDPVVIDGWSQPGFAGQPLIELDGSLTCVPCEDSGLSITAGGSTVRGSVVADFAGAGLELLHGGGNVVVGNYVGTDVSGTVPRGNGRGVYLALSSGNTIGGASPELRNVVSGNLVNGVTAAGNSNGNVILGNYIGTDVTGTAAVPNARAGVQVTGSFDNIIGGDTDGAGNLISGNTLYGLIISSRSERNVVSGNYIGTDVSGSSAVGNGKSGVFLNRAGSSVIGGDTAGSGNVISGNLQHGVWLSGAAATGNRVEGNLIGVGADGVSPLGNATHGVRVAAGASNNQIGAATSGGGNTIAHNGRDGVSVTSDIVGTAVAGNSMAGNFQLGIDLGEDGATANDAGDVDEGANDLQNHPVLGSALLQPDGDLEVRYLVDSAVGSSTYPLRVEFFLADTSGAEGAVYVGADVYEAADAGSEVTVTFTPAVLLAGASLVVATATDADGDTSEFSGAVPVGGSVLTVTTTADSGPGSLREAITLANAMTASQRIEFSIGTGHQVIRPLTVLPLVTDPVVIDGWSQPGFAGQPLIELDGSLTCVPCEDSGLSITAGGSTVRGLVVADFAGAGLELLHGGGNVVVGNYVGTDVSGTVPRGNGRGVYLALSSGNTIGGASPELRNVVSGNLVNGVTAAGNSNGNVILGNYIGTDVTGTAAVPNARAGVQVTGSFDNIIGGDTDGAGNLISGNTLYGLIISSRSERNVVSGNYIGTDVSGSSAVGNGKSGVFLNRAGSSVIGGDTAGSGNVISGNLQHGVWLSGAAATGNRVEGNLIGVGADGVSPLGNATHGVRVAAGASNNQIGAATSGGGNTIAHNGRDGVSVTSDIVGTAVAGNSMAGNFQLGIDLGEDGATANDAGDVDEGANDLQNHPVLGSALLQPDGDLEVRYLVDSAVGSSTYPLRVEFFLADTSGAEGAVYVGADVYEAADAGSEVTVTFTPAVLLAGASLVVATATDADGDTSEFSGAVPVGGSVLTVTTTADSGPGSLREAITLANAMTASQRIEFSIGTGHQVIRPLTVLPLVTDPVVIDGWSQPGFAGQPLIELDGSLTCVPCEDSGLSITAGGSTVRGLVVADFAGAGLELLHGGGNVVVGNYVGTDVSGTVPRGNGRGVYLALSSGNTIGGASPELRNVVSGNLVNGVTAAGNSNGNVILGNYIGTDVTGTAAVPNARAGVQVTGSFDNIIGGDTDGAGNLISGNTLYGLIISSRSERNVVSGNYIGTDVSGSSAVGNGKSGVFLNRAGSSVIGGDTAGSGNVISGNLQHGVWLSGAAATGNRVEGNLIGVGADGVSPLGNATHGVRVAAGASNNQIGAATSGGGNTIAHNGRDGVSVTSDIVGTAVAGNSMAGNFQLGIDLGEDGATANDAGDVDEGANDLQNHPVLGSALLQPDGDLEVRYLVDSAVGSSTYPLRVEFFLADTSGAEGAVYVGADVYEAADAGSEVTVTFTPATPVIGPGDLVATATDANDNTSEFSTPTSVE